MARFSTRNLSISIKNKSIDRTISDLNIKVVAAKTISANPNQANIEIYNLNQNSREELFNNIYDEDQGNTEIIVTLDDKVIFQGQLINVNSIYSATEAEWKTILYCGDGFNAARTTMNKKYPKGTTALEMIQDMGSILEEEGVAVLGVIEGLKDCLGGKSIAKALVFNGEVIKNMIKIFKECSADAETYIDEGKVNALTKDSTIKNNIVIINKGLIEPPTLSEQGINCKVTLNSEIKIGAQIQVKSRSQIASFGNLSVYRPKKIRISGDGIYKVQEIKHSVDNYSPEVAKTEIVAINTQGNLV